MPAATFPTARPAPRVGAIRFGLTLPGLWLRRIRMRRALAALHVDQIRETGLDPFRLHEETLKPFWRA